RRAPPARHLERVAVAWRDETALVTNHLHSRGPCRRPDRTGLPGAAALDLLWRCSLMPPTDTMPDATLDGKVPEGPIADKWDYYKNTAKLVNPANKRKYTVLVVGTGLAGGSAAATLAELGYNVKSFCIQDSPRRAHSIAAQGGINA